MSSDAPTPRNVSDEPGEHREPEIRQPIQAGIVEESTAGTSEAESGDSGTSSRAEVSCSDSGSMESLHPTSLLFDVIAHARTYIIPGLIALFSAASGTWGGVWFAAMFFVPAIATSTIRFMTLRFVIRNSELVVTEGLLFRKVRIVPVQRIQNVDLVQNVLHRLIGVAEVRVETASGTEPEAVLRVLSLTKIARLREAIFSRRPEGLPDPVAGDLVAAATVATSDPARSETVLQIPTGWLVRAGLASNRGFVMVGILLGLYFQFDQDFKFLEKWNIQQATEWLTGNFGFWGQLLIGILAALVLLILLRLVGIAWFLLHFHGYRLVRIGEDLRISCGLFTKVSATVPVPRVQFISVHQNLIMRWMGMASIRIETAGGAGNEKESATTTVGRRWFIPVLPVDQVPSILIRLRKDLQWNTEDLDWHSLAPRAGYRLLRLALIQSCFCFLLIAFGVVQALYLNHPGALYLGSWWPFSVALGVIIPPALIIHAFKQSRSKKYARTDYGVVYRSGILTRKTSVTFFEKIQTLRIEQSPFDRRWRMARLSIDTAAAGPADHLISVPYLDAAFAKQEFAELNQKAACHQPRFG